LEWDQEKEGIVEGLPSWIRLREVGREGKINAKKLPQGMRVAVGY